MKKNDIYVAEVIDYTFEAYGVVKIDNFTLFVDGVIKGEIIELVVVKVYKNYAYAKLLNLIKPSSHRIYNLKKTSGANLIHMAYPLQLIFKRDKIINLLERENLKIKVVDCLGSVEYHYRNKSIFPLQQKDGKILLGYFRERSHQVVDMDKCYLQFDKHNLLMNKLRVLINKYQVSIYDENTHQGLLRYIFLRSSKDQNNTILGFIATKFDLVFKQLSTEILSWNLGIDSIVINLNPQKNNVIIGKENQIIYGNGYLIDQLADLKFKISLNSFYQVNPSQCEKLYQLAIELAQLKATDVVIDAYSGIGTIALTISKYVKQVYAIEVVKAAVKDAKINQKLNNVNNVEFILGKCEDQIESLTNKYQIDLIFVDPPRKGCDQSFLNTIAKSNIAKIVYISCNPISLIRDLKYLQEYGYYGEFIYPVDMFPQTDHVESVVVLTNNNIKKHLNSETYIDVLK